MADDRTAVDTPSRALHYVREAFPDLDAHEARALDEGWASYPYMIDDTWVFRFPRGDRIPADQVERQYRKERQFLPRLAPRVAVAVPEIECVAELSDGRTFMGHRAIHGVPLTRDGIDAMSPSACDAIVVQFAGFLRALHDFPIDEAREVGVHDSRGRDEYAEFGEETRHSVFPALSAHERAGCATLFEMFLGDDGNFECEAVVTHGDLGGRHVLLDETPRVVGIIDYGSVGIGDATYDFFPAVFDLGEEFTRRVLAEYGHRDPDRAVGAAYFYRVADVLDGWLEGIREGAEWKIEDKRRELGRALEAYAERGNA